MPSRTAKQILAEWHELAMRREEAPDDIDEGLTARIEQLRREYIEGTPPKEPPAAPSHADDYAPNVQTRKPL
jgi:hypothetical protein